jgi:hypothetical protein
MKKPIINTLEYLYSLRMLEISDLYAQMKEENPNMGKLIFVKAIKYIKCIGLKDAKELVDEYINEYSLNNTGEYVFKEDVFYGRYKVITWKQLNDSQVLMYLDKDYQNEYELIRYSEFKTMCISKL